MPIAIGTGVGFGGGSIWKNSSKFKAIDIADSQPRGPAAILDFRRGKQAITNVASGSIAGATSDQLASIANDTYANALTFTRASTATYIDMNGVLQTAAIDVPRFDYSNGSRQHLVEGASTNYVKNSDTTGAVVGVIGSGGALPTTWVISPVSGITFEVVSKGIELGLPYVDIRISGTNATGATAFPGLLLMPQNGGGANVAATTEAWTGSVYTKLIASPALPASGVYGKVQLQERDVSGTFLVATTLGASATGTTSRIVSTKNGGLNAATTQMTMSYFYQIAVAETVDFTIRYYAPQLEKLPFASSYIPTTGSAVTRSAETALFSAKLLALVNRANCTIVLKGKTLGLQPSGVLLSNDNGLFMYQNGGDPRIVNFGLQNAPAISAGISATNKLPGPFGAVFAYAPASRSWSATGQTASTDANTMAGGLTSAGFGYITFGNFGYFLADQLIIYPFRATDAEIQRLAAAYV